MTNELDNYKIVWNTITEKEFSKEYSINDLRKIVKKRSGSELSKIRRKIIFEGGITLMLSIFLVVFIHFISPEDTLFALIFIGAILAISFLPYITIIRLKFSNHSDLQCYLREFILRFDNLVKQYIRMSTVLMPVVVLGGFLLGFHSATNQYDWNSFFTVVNIILLALFILLASLGGSWIQRRYYNWVYGKNIQRLKACLLDLEEAEDKEDAENQ